MPKIYEAHLRHPFIIGLTLDIHTTDKTQYDKVMKKWWDFDKKLADTFNEGFTEEVKEPIF